MPQPTSRREAVQVPADIDLANLEVSGVVAAVVLTLDGRIMSANPRMRRLLGLARCAFGDRAAFHGPHDRFDVMADLARRRRHRTRGRARIACRRRFRKVVSRRHSFAGHRRGAADCRRVRRRRAGACAAHSSSTRRTHGSARQLDGGDRARLQQLADRARRQSLSARRGPARTAAGVRKAEGGA